MLVKRVAHSSYCTIYTAVPLHKITTTIVTTITITMTSILALAYGAGRDWSPARGAWAPGCDRPAPTTCSGSPLPSSPVPCNKEVISVLLFFITSGGVSRLQ